MTNEKDSRELTTFHVIDNNTGEEADIEDIACTEEWAKLLMSIDMEGFALEEDGTLMLVDECGQFAYCPEGRFTIRFNGTPEQIKKHDDAVRAEAVKAERERCNPWLLTLSYYINNPSAWRHFDQSMSDNIETCLRNIDPAILSDYQEANRG